jgi:LPS export ABC transporter protein LptC
MVCKSHILKNLIKKNSSWLVLMVMVTTIVFGSCENDLEVVQAFGDPGKIPDATSENSEIMYYDSSLLKVKIVSPIILRFSLQKYMEFPKGIHVQLYDSLKNVKAEVKSKYALYKEKEDLWEARKDVVVISKDGKQLNTEQLFWDRNKKIIYSNKFCRIRTATANLTGNKFTATEDFSAYELSSVQGPLEVKDDETE